MLTMNITNDSGVDIVAGDGVLPNSLSWLSLADGLNVDVVIQVADLTRVEDNHSGFTFGELLQELKQRGVCSFTFTDLGDTAADGSVPDEGHGLAA